jgi:hypothetical protein
MTAHLLFQLLFYVTDPSLDVLMSKKDRKNAERLARTEFFLKAIIDAIKLCVLTDRERPILPLLSQKQKASR